MKGLGTIIGPWRLAFRNLSRNHKRNFATAAAIALGFAAVLALGGYGYRTEHFLAAHAVYVRQTGHISIYKQEGLEQFTQKPGKYSLSKQEQEQIAGTLAAMSEVDFFGAQLIGSGLVGNGCKSLPFVASSIEPAIDRQARLHPEVQKWAPQFLAYTKGKGLWEYEDDFGAVALSTGLARFLGKTQVVSDFPQGTNLLVIQDCQSPKLREQLAADANVQLVSSSWAGDMTAVDGEVVAHFQTGLAETNNSSLTTSLVQLQKLLATEHVTFFAVWLQDPKELAGLLPRLRAKFAEQGLKLELYPWYDERINPMYAGTIDFLYLLISFLASILAIIIIFSIFNSTTITIIERSQEIGMMRSLGFTRLQIRSHYLREIGLLSCLALGVGALIGSLGIWLINRAQIIYHPPGIAEGMHLELVLHLPLACISALSIFLLVLLTTLLAISHATSRPIPVLLSGAQR